MGLKWFTDLDNVLPFAGMVMVMLLQVSNMVVCKAALSQGLDKYVLIVYSGILSTLLLFPFPVFFTRSASPRPPLTWDVLFGFISLAVIGSIGQVCENAGMLYSSPTLGTALLNLTPAFTFILAFLFRMEKFRWKSSSSLAKVAGTLVSIGGAFVVTFYKGPAMMKVIMSSSSAQESNWILGGFFLTIEALAISSAYIIQAFILKKYPALLFVMLYSYSFAIVFSAASSLIIVKDSSAWSLRLDMGLLAIVYTAVSGLFKFSLCLWCLGKTGPLFVSMFKPLAIIFSGIMSVLFLGDILCLGSVIGAAIIVVGFYGVMWGKAKEKDDGEESSVLPSSKLPLLQNRIQE